MQNIYRVIFPTAYEATHFLRKRRSKIFIVWIFYTERRLFLLRDSQ